MNPLSRYWYRYKYRQTSYAPLFNKPSDDELVALDCETTSLDPDKAELVSIAAIKIRGNTLVTSEPLLLSLRAPTSLNAQSIKVHGIRHQDLVNGIEEKDAMLRLIDYIGNRPIVGYYIHYDKTVLSRYTKRLLGFKLPNAEIEVSNMYRKRLEQALPNAYYDLSMEAIGHHLDLPLSGRHDALQDAISAALIYVRLKYGDVPIPIYY
ncbi:3'-5' exonuclease [Enterovibrio nigricans]|uniref:DNA polymerase-3 subunit epsilon n=1 Tax=Enterovibrio nigricans DSM 22720 TaxID=1121868 RepID=A0A1T4V9G8_9GAMM|nr:3'-5' exonuclease [Enterovibrio nigricans]PKF50157.1 3'-5' exonuclease [Enterovibrio nigricans]SKA61552.1 DNA polymerase-3 subunit epsilon [Enterovibrio nigricans DSM 22720]